MTLSSCAGECCRSVSLVRGSPSRVPIALVGVSLHLPGSEQNTGKITFRVVSPDILAPPIKQKARFKIKDAKCHLRPRNRDRIKDVGKQQAVIGMWGSVCVGGFGRMSANGWLVSFLFCK